MNIQSKSYNIIKINYYPGRYLKYLVYIEKYFFGTSFITFPVYCLLVIYFSTYLQKYYYTDQKRFKLR